MTNIDYLPKFYNREDIKTKAKEYHKCVEELLSTNKLTINEIEELKQHDFELSHMLLGDAYSRNYVIRRLKELQKFVSCR